MPYEEVYGTSFEDMNRRVPDLTKIHQFVGYQPTVSLDELLRGADLISLHTPLTDASGAPW